MFSLVWFFSTEGWGWLYIFDVTVMDVSWSFNVGGGRGYDDSVPGEVTITTPSGDRIT